MLSIQSKINHTSKVAEGVTFTVRTLNRIQRAKRDFPIAEHDYEYRMYFNEALSLLPKNYFDLPTGEDRTAALKAQDPETKRARSIADYKAALLEDEYLKPAYIKAGLISIDGAEVDGAPVTPETLLASSIDFDALIDEIYLACREASGLTAVQLKNSESPTTGSGPVETEATPSSAVPVNA